MKYPLQEYIDKYQTDLISKHKTLNKIIADQTLSKNYRQELIEENYLENPKLNITVSQKIVVTQKELEDALYIPEHLAQLKANSLIKDVLMYFLSGSETSLAIVIFKLFANILSKQQHSDEPYLMKKVSMIMYVAKNIESIYLLQIYNYHKLLDPTFNTSFQSWRSDMSRMTPKE